MLFWGDTQSGHEWGGTFSRKSLLTLVLPKYTQPQYWGPHKIFQMVGNWYFWIEFRWGCLFYAPPRRSDGLLGRSSEARIMRGGGFKACDKEFAQLSIIFSFTLTRADCTRIHWMSVTQKQVEPWGGCSLISVVKTKRSKQSSLHIFILIFKKFIFLSIWAIACIYLSFASLTLFRSYFIITMIKCFIGHKPIGLLFGSCQLVRNACMDGWRDIKSQFLELPTILSFCPWFCFQLWHESTEQIS